MINDLQKDSLQAILNNEILLSAIRSVFDETIELSRPMISVADDNALLGEKFRAYEVAKTLIERGFIDLLSYKVVKGAEKKFNKAR